jgi:hypothetical protein
MAFIVDIPWFNAFLFELPPVVSLPYATDSKSENGYSLGWDFAFDVLESLTMIIHS